MQVYASPSRAAIAQGADSWEREIEYGLMGYLFGIAVEVLLWTGLSALVGLYWLGKGHSFIAGFVSSVFLTPVVGLFLGAVLPSGRRHKSTPSLECPYCHARQSAENALCDQCYRDLKQVNADTGEIEPVHRNH